MKLIFKDVKLFTLLYFLVFIIDTFIKNSQFRFPFRYISKTFLILILLLFYIVNQKEKSVFNYRLVLLALFSFIIGDLVLVGENTTKSFAIGGVFFGIAKAFYIVRFRNKKDFYIKNLLPFLLFCFIYMSLMMNFIYSKLGLYFIPTLIYLFVVLLLGQIAYLRKNEVNNLSYYLVLIGVLFSMASDSIAFLKSFYDPSFFYHKYTIMLFYSLSQYLIVLGILKENNTPVTS